ncbi:MAG: type II toxin-antitoxin system PemK/MazF family toxin [Candidatus Latescibacteria bacterium]|nr:type II toxin-antitoxin system PemK/MazF family toxin [Candidatus Latescibacterota bacterium]NIO56158.1 type II toxin-antitoxin system PemK/MazF family toxin [Candidatus Latescibacterota bacterium]
MCHWAALPWPHASERGYRRPVLIIQADAFNRSKIRAVIAVVITSNMQLSKAPGNVSLTRRRSGLPKSSVVNVSQIVTLDKSYLADRVGKLTRGELRAVEEGIRLVLSL